jgi:hypothetical protein
MVVGEGRDPGRAWGYLPVEGSLEKPSRQLRSSWRMLVGDTHRLRFLALQRHE